MSKPNEVARCAAVRQTGRVKITVPAMVSDDVPIMQDAEGRYRLNDVKTAAKPHKSQRTNSVSTYLRRKATQKLITAIRNQDTTMPDPTTTFDGWGGGTFVCKELVLDYAWGISQAFFEAVQLALKEEQQITHFNSTTQEQKNMKQENTSTQNTNSLIPVFSGTMHGQVVQLCNARDLHAFLQVGKDFSNWVKDRIKKYGFIEGDDFAISCSPNLASSNNQGLSNLKAGANRSDYHLTLDTAKELAMVENNEQGRQARRYFIECEKKLSKVTAPSLPSPQSENALPYDIEKACDFRSWKLSNEYHQHTMLLIGDAARQNDEQVMSESSFLIKRRLYERLVTLAKAQLDKKSPESSITDLVLSWQPQALQSLDVSALH